jgi:hypothetical protein
MICALRCFKSPPPVRVLELIHAGLVKIASLAAATKSMVGDTVEGASDLAAVVATRGGGGSYSIVTAAAGVEVKTGGGGGGCGARRWRY